jgi:HlyD family secretion protein
MWKRVVTFVRRRPRRVLAGVLMLGLGAGVAVFMSPKKAEFASVSARRGDIVEIVTAGGVLQPERTVQVGAELSGVVRTVAVDFNDAVTSGQTLATIDSAQVEAQVADTLAGVAVADAAEKDAEASVQRAMAARDLAALDEGRKASLLNRGFVSRQTYDQARNTLRLAERDVDSAEARRRAAAGSAQRAAAILARARNERIKTAILSPIDGVVISRKIQPGQTLASSFQTPTLFVIGSSLNRMMLLASIDEADIGRVKIGQTATFKVSAFPDRALAGTVQQVRQDPVTDQGVTSYVAVISVGNEDRALLPGMTASVDIAVSQRRGVVTAPIAASEYRPDAGGGVPKVGIVVRRRQDAAPSQAVRKATPVRNPDATLWRVNADGGLSPVAVRLGARDDSAVEILEGDVQPGDRFATAL